MTTVAALFVQTGGVYFDVAGVDPWPQERDARLYDGPYPVVAHPPCARWSSLAWHGDGRRLGRGARPRMYQREALATPEAFRDALLDIARSAVLV